MTYHVRREDRAITDLSRIHELLREGRYATFALCDGGEPYAVTLSYGFDAPARCLYFHVAHEGMKLDFIALNPQACGTVVLTDDYSDGECAHVYRSVVMRGTMRVVNDADEKTHALRTLVEHLESDPESYWASRRLDEPDRMSGFTALCFEIDSLTAKTGS